MSLKVTLNVTMCDLDLCEYCDENTIDVNVDSPTAKQNMLGKYHSKLTSSERYLLLDTFIGCTYC